jgi:tetratricopeptide (TPR) repeat protein
MPRLVRPFLFLTSLFPALTAVAQRPKTPPPHPAPAPAPSGDFKREEARHHFEQAVALYEEGNYPGALAEFQAAYDTAPAAATLFNIGLTYKALYRYPDAIETLQRYLADSTRDGKVPEERRKQVSQLIEEMNSLLAPITFVLQPAEARLVIDGRTARPASGGVVQLAAGTHVAEVVADEHEPQRREFTVAAGIPLTVQVRLARIVRTGKVRVTSSQPNTRVAIDGKDRGFAPLELELWAGGHQIDARAEGYQGFRSELMLGAGQERSVDLDLQRPAASERPVYKKWWFWSALGTAVAGGTAAIFLVPARTQAPLQGPLSPGSVNVSN